MRPHGLVDLALASYPRWWRDRYRNEAEALAEDLLGKGKRSSKVAANLFRGALGAHLWARGLPRQMQLWTKRTRSAVALATLPWLVGLPVLLAVTTTRHVFTCNGQPRASTSTRVLAAGDAYDAMQIVILVGLIAGIIGWAALSNGVRESQDSPRRRFMALYVPLLSFLTVLGLFIARTTQLSNGGHSHGCVYVLTGGNPAVARVLLVVLWSVFALGVVATVVSLGLVSARSEIPLLRLRTGTAWRQ